MKVRGRVLEICLKNDDYYFPFKKLTSSLVVEVDLLEIIKGISSIAGKREQYISDNEVVITEKPNLDWTTAAYYTKN